MTVNVGNIHIGSGYPVVIQSMTTTDTNDIEASVAQCIRIFDAGAHMVRLTTQGMKEVDSLGIIREKLHNLGYTQPLVADVHFLPGVAVAAANVADKVRINPGNYVERSYRGPLQFDKSEQEKQVATIRERLMPLIAACREHNTAIRIGVNHGSLSRRILSWYGDTAEGMVESAMEFIRIFAGENFHQLVVSLKASDSRIMVYANRLLYKKMHDEQLVYPLHLGVTEAGAGEDGIIKSSAGIATLLDEGIGDTIRVSLTEDPEFEIPVARKIVSFFGRKVHPVATEVPGADPFHYQRRTSLRVANIGGKQVPVVVAGDDKVTRVSLLMKECGYISRADLTIESGDKAADYIYAGRDAKVDDMPAGIHFITKGPLPSAPELSPYLHPMVNAEEAGITPGFRRPFYFTLSGDEHIPESVAGNHEILVLRLPEEDAISAGMKWYAEMEKTGDKRPVILYRRYHSDDITSLMIRAAGEMGALLTNGFGDGVWIQEENPSIRLQEVVETAFGILQATKTRISATEYISCPSCGRTLFNIQEILMKIKDATRGLKGVKIAVMGCIVNGPGEMADADFGYVGAGRGKVTLYKGHEAVKKNIPEEEAVDELIALIRKGQPR